MPVPDHSMPYADIIGCSRPESAHAPMPLADRAAQFSPFAALAGHEEAVQEANRFVEERPVLEESACRELDSTLASIRAALAERPRVLVTWFAADELKEGGTCQTHEGRVRTFDELAHALVFEDGAHILVEDILAMRLLPSA